MSKKKFETPDVLERDLLSPEKGAPQSFPGGQGVVATLSSTGIPVDSLPSASEFTAIDRSQVPLASEDAAFGLQIDAMLEAEERYQEQGLIAKGGMSYVHRATDRNLMRDIAMKVIDRELAEQDEVHTQRFIEEARITGQLQHPNIVPVHELNENQGRFYFAMKLVEGQTLKDYIASDSFDPCSDTDLYHVLQIFLKVCDAVSFAHSRGVIHRDLKPSNIMVGDYGQIYVMDWGIAYVLPQEKRQHTDVPIRLKRQPVPITRDENGEILGTWNYMPPEQARGQIDLVSERSDVFTLGAILYEILTRRPPYEGPLFQILQQVQEGKWVPPQEKNSEDSLPSGLCNIIAKAMKPQPDERYASVESLKHDVEIFLRGSGQLPLEEFAKGALILTEGDEGDAAYVIIRGHCSVFKTIQGKKVELRRMGPGEAFGETAVFLAQTRTASVEAISDVVLAVVTRDILEERLILDPWMGRFVKTLARRFREVDQKVTEQSLALRIREVFGLALAYINLYNESEVPDTQSARLTPFIQALQNKFQFTPEEALELLEKVPQLQVNLQAKQLSVSRSDVASYLEENHITIFS